MNNFNISYHNIPLHQINSELKNNKKKIDEIKQNLINFISIINSHNSIDLNEIKNLADSFSKNKKTFVVLGTGGSNLGAKALINILQEDYIKKFYFFDNIDPIKFNNLILKFDLNTTGFIVISKSGTTIETLSQFLTIIEIFKSKNKFNDLSENLVIITEDKDSPLKQIAKKNSYQILDYDKNIGGRYSVLSNVGLFPAYIAGLDILKIRDGANNIFSQVQNNSFTEHIMGAYVATYFKSTQSMNINVLMTYSDALYFFGKWYLQLFAESIGKENKGITPIHSIGTTDQHSQLQLYLDGPKDKYFSLITTDYRNKGIKISETISNQNNVSYLAGKTMGDLMYAEQQATLHTLIKKNVPIREIYCNEIDEFNIGQLMAYFMIETIAVCGFFDVNPFNQPAVEYGKKLAKEYLSLNN